MSQVTIISNQPTKFILSLPPPLTKPKTISLTIIVSDEQSKGQKFNTTFYPPYDNHITISHLSPSKLYRIKSIIASKNSEKISNIFGFTKSQDQQQNSGIENLQYHNRNPPRPRSSHPRQTNAFSSATSSFNSNLSATQQLMKSVGRINNLMSDKQLNKTILAARYSKDVSDFIMSGEKSWKPMLREDRIKKTLLVTQGMQVMERMYRREEGRELGKNDWFMGPFYSFDRNEKEMRRNV